MKKKKKKNIINYIRKVHSLLADIVIKNYTKFFFQNQYLIVLLNNTLLEKVLAEYPYLDAKKQTVLNLFLVQNFHVKIEIFEIASSEKNLICKILKDLEVKGFPKRFRKKNG